MRKSIAAIAVAALCACLAPPASAQYTVLHQFAGQPGDAKGPLGGLTSAGSKLYGMSILGGASNNGALFSMDPDASSYTLLRSFAGQPADGAHPVGTLASDGSTLYGMTEYGGVSNRGAVFAVNSNGSGFTLLHSFAAVPDANRPYANSLLWDNGRLYGMSKLGGDTNAGTIFTLNTDGSGYTILHHFQGGAHGREPQGGLISDGSRLYGMTYYGGTNDKGTLFSLNSNGSGFTVLHHFNDGVSADNGAWPCGSLVSDGTRLYGTAYFGGAHNEGAVFAVNSNGSGFTLLHSFDFTGSGDAAWPMGDLTLVGGVLYGATSWGGLNDTTYGRGAMFAMNTDGGAYTILHKFQGQPANDGERPAKYGGLLFHDYVLYGLSQYGGANDLGTAFSYSLPTPTPTATPPIDLTPNKTTFGRTDTISVTADVWPIPVPCYPFVRIAMADGSVQYYVLGEGFTTAPTPYLGFEAGTITLPVAILGYPVLTANFSGIPVGAYVLEGGAVDMTKTTSADNLIYFGRVDGQTLTVH